MVHRLLALLLMSSASVAHAQACIATRDVPLDELTDHALSGTLPLALPIPAAFRHVTIKDAPQGSSYWMVPGEEAEGKSQGASGHLLAKVASGVYDQAKDDFAGVDDLKEKMDVKGVSVSSDRTLVNGYPVLFVESEDRTLHTKTYTVFVATNEESQAIVVKYRPPLGDPTLGACYWKTLKANLLAAGESDASGSATGSGTHARDVALMRSPQDQSAFIAAFAEAARNGRIDALIAMMSPATRKAAGDEATRANLRNVIAPFFAHSIKLHSEDTVRRSTMPDGRMGVWHYTYAVDAAGKPSPFRIALIAEDGALHAGFVDVGKCIRDRHVFCD